MHLRMHQIRRRSHPTHRYGHQLFRKKRIPGRFRHISHLAPHPLHFANSRPLIIARQTAIRVDATRERVSEPVEGDAFEDGV